MRITLHRQRGFVSPRIKLVRVRTVHHSTWRSARHLRHEMHSAIHELFSTGVGNGRFVHTCSQLTYS